MSQTTNHGALNLGGGAAPEADEALVKDSDIQTFQADVLEASMKVPVIVDFWATWCGPCKTLGPILEKETRARAGAVRMVKVDVDKNQMLAQQLRIQSMPTVMAFVGGQPVDGFVGAVPESEVKAFFDRTLQAAAQMGLGGAAAEAGPSAAEFIEGGEQALAQGDATQASQFFGQASQMAEAGSDEQAAALAGLARCYLALGDDAQARSAIEAVPEAKRSHAAVAQVLAQLSLGQTDAPDGALADAQARVAADPENPDAQMDLAEAQASGGQPEAAIDTLLAMIERDREWNEEAARKKLLVVFDALGPTHPAVKAGRRRLSSVLFS